MMAKSILTVLLLAMLLVLPVAAADEDLAPTWSKTVNGDVTALKTDEYGTVWYVGTSTGHAYCYGAGGGLLWDVAVPSGHAVTGISVAGDDIVLDCTDGTDSSVYLLQEGAIVATKAFQGVVAKSTVSNGLVFTVQPENATMSRLFLWNATGGFDRLVNAVAFESTTLPEITNGCLYLPELVPPSTRRVASYPVEDLLTAVRERGAITIDSPATGLLVVNLYRDAGNTTGGRVPGIHSTLYEPGFTNARFTAPGGANLPYYVRDHNATWAEVAVNVSTATATVYADVATPFAASESAYFDPAGLGAWGSSAYTDHFDGDALDTLIWDVGGNKKTVSVSGGVCTLSTVASGGSLQNGYITTKADSALDTEFLVRAKVTQTGNSGVGLSAGKSQRNYYASPATGAGYMIVYTASARWNDTTQEPTGGLTGAWHTYKFVLRENGTVADYYVDDSLIWSDRRVSFASFPHLEFYTSAWDTGHSAKIEIDYATIGAQQYYNASAPGPVAVVPAATKSVAGNVTRIVAVPGTALIQTETALYLQALSGTGFGTTVAAGPRTGAPHGIDVSLDGGISIEGRSATVDIFRYDGVRTGTYDAGGAIVDVAVARNNGLYALAASGDGKAYLFSKDESSMWYLLWSSASGSPIGAVALAGYGGQFAFARGALLEVYPSTPPAVAEGKITLYMVDDTIPYRSKEIVVQIKNTDGSWGPVQVYETDDRGAAVVEVFWGRMLNILVDERDFAFTLIPTPAQAEYVVRILRDAPLRTGALYHSWYDDENKRIYFQFQDLRGKSHFVHFWVYNESGILVYETSYSVLDGDTSLKTGFYQIPAGATGSYRIRLQVTGSPSYTNSWHQWVSGSDSVARLPGELDGYSVYIFMLFLLFVGGIFSYLTGPYGAVVIALVAGVFVFWGWLPVSPAVAMLCIVWAFLGLLGRTGSG